MSETRRQQSLRLYGRRRIPGSHRKVMVALLAVDGLPGAGGLTSYQLSQLAQASWGATAAILARMEARDLAESWWLKGPGLRRRAYRATGRGAAVMSLLLGLPATTAAQQAPQSEGWYPGSWQEAQGTRAERALAFTVPVPFTTGTREDLGLEGPDEKPWLGTRFPDGAVASLAIRQGPQDEEAAFVAAATHDGTTLWARASTPDFGMAVFEAMREQEAHAPATEEEEQPDGEGS